MIEVCNLILKQCKRVFLKKAVKSKLSHTSQAAAKSEWRILWLFSKNKILHTKNKIILITQFRALKRLFTISLSVFSYTCYTLKGFPFCPILFPSASRRMRSSSTSPCSHRKLIPERCTTYFKMKSVWFITF